MKIIALFLSFGVSFLGFSQESYFGTIVDKDGFVNVRQKPDTQSPIVTTLKSGEIIGFINDSYDEKSRNWVCADHKKLKNLEGCSIHSSRVEPLDKLPKIPFEKRKNNSLIFSNNQEIEISITLKNYSFKDIKPYMSGKYKELYKGKFAIGFDGTTGLDDSWIFDKFEKITLKIGKKIVEIPKKELDNIFNVADLTIENAYLCYFDKKRNRVFIETLVGDGAGACKVLFIFENEKFKEKMTFVPF